jgi:hypothetical protein
LDGIATFAALHGDRLGKAWLFCVKPMVALPNRPTGMGHHRGGLRRVIAVSIVDFRKGNQ